MPFAGHLFVKTEVKAELNQICDNNDAHITNVWDKVVERFNNATKAKNFIKALSAAGIKYISAWKIVKYYDGKLADITAANAAAKAQEAHTLWFKATNLIPGYFGALVGKTNNHRAGNYNPTFQANEIKSGGVVRHRRYRNAEAFLPAADPNAYIEWYASDSAQKRFFTALGKSEIWFTDGGTHQASDFWRNPNPATTPQEWARNFVAEP